MGTNVIFTIYSIAGCTIYVLYLKGVFDFETAVLGLLLLIVGACSQKQEKH